MFYARLDVLAEACRHRIAELADALNIRLDTHGFRYWKGCCPVHGGDGRGGFTLYTTGDRIAWVCHSHHCERDFTDGLFGFVYGVLSHQRYDWDGEEKIRRVSRQEAADFLCRFVGVEWDNIAIDLDQCSRSKFSAMIEAFTAQAKDHPAVSDRERLRSQVSIPSAYYLARGFTPEVLDAHDIGLNVGVDDSRLHDRVIIPFYNAYQTEEVIGYVGRSPHPQCSACDLYHPGEMDCPPKGSLRTPFMKTVVSHEFNDKDVLYHYWHALPFIAATCGVVIAEGAADVWRLCEAGIINSVALGGSTLTDQQHIILHNQNVHHILVATDNDKAGEDAYEDIKELCVGREVVRVRPTSNDFGEASIGEILAIPGIADMLRRLQSVPSYEAAVIQCRGK